MEKHYWKMIKDTEDRALKSLQIQVLDRESTRYGGFTEPNGMVQAKFSIYRVASMIAVYCNRDSKYYQNESVEQSILLGLKYIRSVQHENGLFDYITCNFFSAPDTAFCIKKLIPVYEYLLVHRKELSDAQNRMLQMVEEIVRDGAGGLLEGGFHTPNHRWAIASLLVKCGQLFQNEEMTKAAEAYLREGIDCNEDGEFAEKSAGNYNRVNNDAMIMLSEVTGNDEYDRHTVKNLRMMLTYWEPDDTVFTANSTRFDKDRLCYAKDYYMEYLKMGVKYRIPEFLEMCNSIFEIVEEKHITSPDFLIWYMLYPEFRALETENKYERADFAAYYQESGIARAQQGNFTWTVMNGKSNFFYIHNGTMKLEVKVAGSFCEHRAFRGEKMERITDREYHLSQTMRGWYYLPWKEKPQTSDWWKMDNGNRDKKMGPDMKIDVWVKEVEHGVDLRVKTEGVEGAPWRIELAFSGAQLMSNEYFDLPLTGSEVVVSKKGYTTVSNATDALIVGPCFGEHHFTEGKEDSEGKTAGAATLYLTDYTGFDHVIEIRNKRSMFEGRLQTERV